MSILTVILVAVALPIGHHIAKLARTELKVGEQYFVWAERVLLSLIAGLIAQSLVGFNASIGAGLLALALLWEYPITNYYVSGTLLGIASSTGATSVVMTSYLYFLVAGTETYIHKKSYWKPMMAYIVVTILLGLMTGTARSLF